MTLNNMNTSTTIIWGAIVFMFGIVTGFQIGFHQLRNEIKDYELYHLLKSNGWQNIYIENFK